MESELVFYELQLVKITPMQGNLRLEKVSRKQCPARNVSILLPLQYRLGDHLEGRGGAT